MRVHAAADAWAGMRELVRAYGFGPLRPNTVMLGLPEDETAAAGTASVVALAARLRRNALLALRAGEDAGGAAPDDDAPVAGTIDLWWRGRGANASFLLAIACQLLRSRRRAGARLRLLHVAEPDEDPARAEELLRAFLRDARVPADVEVVPAAAAAGPAFATIRRESARAGLVLIGLRRRRRSPSRTTAPTCSPAGRGSPPCPASSSGSQRKVSTSATSSNSGKAPRPPDHSAGGGGGEAAARRREARRRRRRQARAKRWKKGRFGGPNTNRVSSETSS